MITSGFKVIDPHTGKRPDLKEISKHEEWARGIFWYDLDKYDFAISESGHLLIITRIGNIYNVPPKRFKANINYIKLENNAITLGKVNLYDDEEETIGELNLNDGIYAKEIKNKDKIKESKTYQRLKGQKFGMLTVIGDSEKSGYVAVRCDCGNAKEVKASNMTSGATWNCGCKRRPKTRKSNEKYVTWDASNLSWRVRIPDKESGKQIHVGRFKKYEDAVNAKQEWIRDHVEKPKDEQRESCANCKYSAVHSIAGAHFRFCVQSDSAYYVPYDGKCNRYERE